MQFNYLLLFLVQQKIEKKSLKERVSFVSTRFLYSCSILDGCSVRGQTRYKLIINPRSLNHGFQEATHNDTINQTTKSSWLQIMIALTTT